MIQVLRIDLGLRPSEDPERVVRSEVGEREGDRAGAGAGSPRGGGVEEFVADEVVVRRVRRGVDA